MSLSPVKTTLSCSDFFSSDMMARAASTVKAPSWLAFFIRWAWDSEGVFCEYSIASSTSICSSFVRQAN